LQFAVRVFDRKRAGEPFDETGRAVGLDNLPLETANHSFLDCRVVRTDAASEALVVQVSSTRGERGPIAVESPVADNVISNVNVTLRTVTVESPNRGKAVTLRWGKPGHYSSGFCPLQPASFVKHAHRFRPDAPNRL